MGQRRPGQGPFRDHLRRGPGAEALAAPSQSLSWQERRWQSLLALGPWPPCPAVLNPPEPLTQTPAYGQRAIAERRADLL